MNLDIITPNRAMQLVLDSTGLTVKMRNSCFLIVSKERQVIVNPAKITSIAVTSSCTISTAAIRLALHKNIPIYFLDKYGKVEGRLWSAGFGKWASIRRKQYLFGSYPEATDWVVRLLSLKTQGQIRNLNYLKDRRPSQTYIVEKSLEVLDEGLNKLNGYQGKLIADCRDELMGHEGGMARGYWKCISACLPPEWAFEGRSRQPAVDQFNAGLNYLYGMLYGIVETTLFSAGLDPYQAVLHGDQYNKPTLSFDLIEPFRPWVDRLLIESILQAQLLPEHFLVGKEGECTLSKTGKAYLIPLFNQYLYEQGVFEDKRTRRRNHIYRLAGSLADTLEHLDI